MEQAHEKKHSFVIRLWLEGLQGAPESHWRGHITHLPSERKMYIDRVENILTFMQEFLPINDIGKQQPDRQ